VNYEAGLRDRGSLTVWISLTDGKLVNWDAPRPRRRKPGRQRKYSNYAIETAVTLGMVFHLSSRQIRCSRSTGIAVQLRRNTQLRADEQKGPRFIAGCIACRTDRQSHLIGQS